jgi:glutathione synthase/RimK-type ligase-like ATP-grasp enzyme
VDEEIAEHLNRSCRCVAVDTQALAGALESGAATAGLYASILRDQPHLFSETAVFLSRRQFERMAAVVAAVEDVVATPAFQEHALSLAPAIARFEPGPRGAFLGYDFHLGADGPHLIEINTNAGGALLNVALARAQRACCVEVERALAAPGAGDEAEAAFVAMFRREWELQSGTTKKLGSIAIVDSDPTRQYLYPEFLMFKELFEKADISATIVDPSELELRGCHLSAGGRDIDLVYNRLTDFYFEDPSSSELRAAYEASCVVVTPGPRAHALYADKRHLAILSDAAAMRAMGVDAKTADLIAESVPRTVVMTDDNRDELWRERKRHFFKPAGGYGSKAAYRGDKITRGVWEELAGRSYVAQRIAPPTERTIVQGEREVPLKLDVRCYVYDGSVQLVASRLYQGQTTNFRTQGGGFAPVFTEATATAA